MTHLDLLRRYLARNQDLDVADHGYPFVTISREPGAGGHTLGREIVRAVDQLPGEPWTRGWDLFDQKLCAVIAQDPGSQASFESLIREDYSSGLHQSIYEMFVGRAEEHALQKKVAAVVRFLAFVGRVVIIGRAGMCIARGFAAGVHVRLVAPMEVRVRRIMDVLACGEEQARAEIQRQERSRARLIRDYYDCDIGDPLLYDFVFNTVSMDNTTMARAVVLALQERRARTSGPQMRPFQP
jgi:cytidylate kinase